MRPWIPAVHPFLLTMFMCLLTLGVVLTAVWNVRRRRLKQAVWLLIAYCIFAGFTLLAAT
ncbi:hypothetical protein NZD89_01505 [Alicyclobacillus fastidiosus]|uniref:DUF2306 domain-containing protein n=1 Tax=Alicyclobacillus fastidiosus TaxID=392011 RepID=A0ABY6ZH44_9BACL|nr:hypothetical protein [Alicyclobacillus fastidiosus]WAH42218.1 hypothetical protein NZD89_01505 [Alicyclobacillus fastidiosus]GMA64012.1 hypothetical protein GCM10025859_44520 [Alicyclobacillus fastidiosus]